MSLLEYKQECEKMPVSELLTQLYGMEKALNKKWPLAEKVVRLEEYKEKYSTEPSEYEKNEKTVAKCILGVSIAAGILAIIFYGLSIDGGLIALLFRLLSIFGAVFFVIGVILSVINIKGIKKSTNEYIKERSEYQAELAQAEASLEACSKECDVVISLISLICPKECYNPKYMRKYISFFEDGRADSIKEARNLFDEYIYREKMIESTNQQSSKIDEAIMAAEGAKIAANSAADAANSAVNAARQAKTSSDWAAYNSRFKR